MTGVPDRRAARARRAATRASKSAFQRLGLNHRIALGCKQRSKRDQRRVGVSSEVRIIGAIKFWHRDAGGQRAGKCDGEHGPNWMLHYAASLIARALDAGFGAVLQRLDAGHADRRCLPLI